MGKSILDEVIKETIKFLDSQGNEVSLNASATRRQYAPNATDAEWEQFVDTIEANGLDPRRKEVYFQKYKTKDGTEKVSIVTGYQVYISRALKSGKLKRMSSPRIKKPEIPNGKKLNDDEKRAWIDSWYGEIDIERNDLEQMETWETPMREVNKHQSLWNVMPEFMLKKNTATQALRFHMADVIGGLPYTSEEIASGVAEIDKGDYEGKIELTDEELKAKEQARLEAIQTIQDRINKCNDIIKLDKLYSTEVINASELKGEIEAMLAERRRALIIVKLSELTSISTFEIKEFVNDDMIADSLVQDALLGNVDAIRQLALDINSFLKAKQEAVDDGSLFNEEAENAKYEQ